MKFTKPMGEVVPLPVPHPPTDDPADDSPGTPGTVPSGDEDLPSPAEGGDGADGPPPAVPVAFDDGGDGPQRRRIIPQQWRRENRRATLTFLGGLWWYKVAYHGLRSPLYALVTLWYAIRALPRLTGQLWAWWQWTDGWVLESQAVAAGRSGHHDAM